MEINNFVSNDLDSFEVVVKVDKIDDLMKESGWVFLSQEKINCNYWKYEWVFDLPSEFSKVRPIEDKIDGGVHDDFFKRFSSSKCYILTVKDEENQVVFCVSPGGKIFSRLELSNSEDDSERYIKKII